MMPLTSVSFFSDLTAFLICKKSPAVLILGGINCIRFLHIQSNCIFKCVAIPSFLTPCFPSCKINRLFPFSCVWQPVLLRTAKSPWCLKRVSAPGRTLASCFVCRSEWGCLAPEPGLVSSGSAMPWARPYFDPWLTFLYGQWHLRTLITLAYLLDIGGWGFSSHSSKR